MNGSFPPFSAIRNGSLGARSQWQLLAQSRRVSVALFDLLRGWSLPSDHLPFRDENDQDSSILTNHPKYRYYRRPESQARPLVAHGGRMADGDETDWAAEIRALGGEGLGRAEIAARLGLSLPRLAAWEASEPAIAAAMAVADAAARAWWAARQR